MIRSYLDRRRRLSLVWAIPVVTALIGLFLAWQTLSERGPLITITFERASGLIAGQSHVRHNDVDIGLVERVGLSNDLQHAVVTVRMSREAEPLLTDKSQFWIVRPRFFAGAVTGLETLVSGSYINVQTLGPGGQPQREFKGLETPPVLTANVPGRSFLLKAQRLGNISLGSPVFYRDLSVGEVLGWDVGTMADNVTIHAFVQSPYDKYVRDDSRFWNASGATVALGPNGLELKVASLRAVLLGGIAFDTPSGTESSAETAANHTFTLFPDEDAAQSAGFRRLPLVTYFTGSVSGLQPRAAVTLRGITIGQVKSVGLQYDRTADNVVVPVYFSIEPDRIAELHLPSGGDLDELMRNLIQRGLRAKLESANLLTGQMRLAMDIYPNLPLATLTKEGDTYVIPSLPGQSADVVTAASDLLAKLNRVPFDSIGDDLSQALHGVNNVVNGPDLHQSVASLRTTLADADILVQRLNTASSPLAQRMPAIVAELDQAARRLNTLVGSVESGYGGDSQFNRNASRLLAQLTDTARSFRVLADLLSRHPEALIRGRTGP